METLKFILPVMDYVAVLPQMILVATALIVLVMGVFKDMGKGLPLIGHVSLAGSVLALVSVIFTGSRRASILLIQRNGLDRQVFFFHYALSSV